MLENVRQILNSEEHGERIRKKSRILSSQNVTSSLMKYIRIYN